MKTPDKLAEENIALLVGTEALKFYLNGISWNLRTMTAQADVLETVIIEMKEAAVQPRRAGAFLLPSGEDERFAYASPIGLGSNIRRS